jgi:hypothetical protein
MWMLAKQQPFRKGAAHHRVSPIALRQHSLRAFAGIAVIRRTSGVAGSVMSAKSSCRLRNSATCGHTGTIRFPDFRVRERLPEQLGSEALASEGVVDLDVVHNALLLAITVGGQPGALAPTRIS